MRTRFGDRGVRRAVASVARDLDRFIDMNDLLSEEGCGKRNREQDLEQAAKRAGRGLDDLFLV
ncbi:MAG: hypothetical protein ACI841_001494 [Planctomycetota bacterium]|jgi:hypothetical protein